MKKLFLFFSLIGAISLPSFASVSANVSFATDYIWRGMTQTGEEPAISGGFDYAADGGFYAGIWGSNVNFSEGAGSELDLYFGYAFETESGIGIDISYVDFIYPGDTALDFQEIGIGLSYGDFGLGYYSGLDGAADYMDFSYALGDVTFSYGDYDTYGSNILISYGFGCGEYDCSLAYSDFSSDSEDLMDEDALVFAVGASF
tara:strand:- start:170 stop:775 length:606 start_codon:yes stop_codon:yes gene_type:complete